MRLKRKKTSHKLAKYLGFLLIPLIALVLSNGGDNARALDDSSLNPYIDGYLAPGKCLSKGNFDFVLFLNSVINFDGITDGVFEPVYDVITRNQCQAEDIFALIKDRDRLRADIRRAFLTCATQKLPNLELAYFEANAEIYYVRNIVQGNIVVGLPFDILSTRMLEDPASLFYPTDLLYTEMKDKYLEKIGAGEFEALFNKLQAKYKERKEDYVLCENGSWDAVSDKWKEFIENAAGVTPAANDFAEGIAGRAEKIAEAATEPGFVDYLAGLVQVNLNNLPPREGVGDIIEGLQEVNPFEGVSRDYSNIDQRTATQAILAEERVYNTAIMRETMMANFSALYRNAGDSSTQIFARELSEFNQLLLDSLGPMADILGCTKVMNARQCPGK